MLVFVALRVAAEVTRRAAPPCFSRVVVTAAVPPLPSTCPPFLLMFGAASGVACKAGTFNLVVFDRQAPLFRRWSDILAVLAAGTTPGSRRKTFWTVGCWKPSRAAREILDRANEAKGPRRNEVIAPANHSRISGMTPARPRARTIPPTMHPQRPTATAQARRQTLRCLHRIVPHLYCHQVQQQLKIKTAPQ